MKILITGSTGFIGRNLKEYFEKIYDVKAPSHQVLNLLNTELVEQYLKINNFDIIIHAANTNDVKDKELNQYDILDRNLRMFYNLERCNKYYGKMYYFGSGAEYDTEHYISFMSEDYFGKHIPRDPYGFSKYIMNSSLKGNGNIYNLRLFGVFGKYEEWERRFISNALVRGICGIPITINQNVYFDYLYINDLIEILKWFINNEPKLKDYNICTGTKIDLLTIASKVRFITDSKHDIIIYKDGYKLEYTGDNRRMLNELNTINFTSIDKSINELYHFYIEKVIKEGGVSEYESKL